MLKYNHLLSRKSCLCPHTDNLEADREESGGTDDSMEGELVGIHR